MKILITGATGLIGKSVQKMLRAKGHELLLASRKEPRNDSWVQWDYDKGFSDSEKLEGVETVIHLAGERVRGLRWTEDKQRAALPSYVTTRVCSGITRKYLATRKNWKASRPLFILPAKALAAYVGPTKRKG